MFRRRLRLARLALPVLVLAVAAPAAVARTVVDRATGGSVDVAFDWAGGDGYAGWQRAASGDSPFRLESAPAGRAGLWIWPAGDAEYGPGWVEWRFDAPGDSRIGGAQARYAYRNQLLAHHCISLGLRNATATVVAQTICSPGGHANDAAVSLSFADPAATPSATQFFFRVQMPECKSGNAKACTKHIPSNDILKNFARLVSASFAIVDRDAPTVAASGALWERRGGFVNGAEKLGVTLTAHDDGVGVARTWLDAIGSSAPLASAAGSCDGAHRTRVTCAADAQLTTTIDTSALPDGRVTFTGRARDAAGNTGATDDFTVRVDRTLPQVNGDGPLVTAGYTNGTGNLGVTAYAADDGGEDAASGVAQVALFADDREVASASPTCTGVQCPETHTQEFSVDVGSLSEGSHAFALRARDGAGNASAAIDGSTWALVVDRTPPAAPTNLHVARFDASTETATVRWDRVDGGGAYEYRYSLGDDEWSDWLAADVPELELESTALGEVFDAEVRAVDVAGNTGPAGAAHLTVFDGGEAPAAWETGEPEPGTFNTLTDPEQQRAVEIAQQDAAVTSALAGRAATPVADSVVPLTLDNGQRVGAQLTLALAAPSTIETDWRVLEWNDEGTAYQQKIAHATATNVTSLNVLVDFRNGRAISLEPDADAEMGDVTATRDGISRAATGLRALGRKDNEVKSGGRNVYRLTKKLVPQLGNDSFWNWDFKHKRSDLGTENARRDTDWPVNLIWTGQADLDAAKDIWNKGKAYGSNHLPFENPLLWVSSPMYAYLTDAAPRDHTGGLKGSWSDWDEDKGVNLGAPCHPTLRRIPGTPIPIPFPGVPVPGLNIILKGHKWHYRVYAPGPTRRLYNMTWGYYVFASSHQDHLDDGGPGPTTKKRICPGDWYGGSEDTEERVAAEFRKKGRTVLDDAVNLHNWDERQRTPHLWYDNNGKASVIKIGDPPKAVKNDPPKRPKSSGTPLVNGETVVGNMLVADPGLWDASEEPTFAYRWLVCDPAGANCSPNERGASLSLADAQVGKTLRVRVTAKTSGGIARALSAATSPVRGLGGACGTTGDVPAAGAGAPANDDFRNAARLAGASGLEIGSLTGASVQQGGARREVDYAGYEGFEDWGYGSKPTVSVWYCWTAPESGPVTLTTRGSPPPLRGETLLTADAAPPRLNVYTGTTWGVDGEDPGGDIFSIATAWVNKYAGAWNTPEFERWSELGFDAVAGTQYLFYVSNGTLCCESPDHGTFNLRWGPNTDTDGDGVANDVDNCPSDSNSEQSDYDGNGRGDACDPAPLGVRVVNQTRYRIVSYAPRCPYGFDPEGGVCYFGGSLYNAANWKPASYVDCAPFSTCTYTIAAGVGPSMQLRAVGTYPAAMGDAFVGRPLGYQGSITGGTTSNGGCSATPRGDGFCQVVGDAWAADLDFRDDYDSNRDGLPDPTDDYFDQFCRPRSYSANQNQCHISIGWPGAGPYGPYTFTVYVRNPAVF